MERRKIRVERGQLLLTPRARKPENTRKLGNDVSIGVEIEGAGILARPDEILYSRQGLYPDSTRNATTVIMSQR